MAETAAYLVDTLLPEAPYRQWVLSFPWPLRFRLAVDRRLFTALIGAFLRTVFAWQRRRGRALGIVGGESGAVTFVQRFGGALNLNPHLHGLVPEGLFVPGESEGEPLRFVPLPAPAHEKIEALTWHLARRLVPNRLRHRCAPTSRGSPCTRRVWYRQMTAWRSSEPGELLGRLAALVPAPYSHMVRYHGVFANRSRCAPCYPPRRWWRSGSMSRRGRRCPSRRGQPRRKPTLTAWLPRTAAGRCAGHSSFCGCSSSTR